MSGRTLNLVSLLVLAGLAFLSQASATDQLSSSDNGHPDLNTIVARMEQAAQQQRESARSYVATREYQMFGKNSERPASEVTAQISFVPPSSRDFQITESKGSSRGESIVRNILETEKKSTESGSRSTAITRDNYDFALDGEQNLNGHRCYVLQLLPKRKEKSLVRGRAWVDAESYLVRRIEGEMAKLPSWWLKDISLSLQFGEVGGMWMQTATTAIAEIRLIGEHTLTARLVTLQLSNVVASNRTSPVKDTSRPRRFSRSDTNLGTGIMPRP